MLNVDRTDRRILYELDRNSRYSYRQLSKRLRIDPETIRYRVDRLFDEGVISRFFTLVDISRAGYSMYKVLLKLQIASKREVEELVQFLVAHDSVLWVVELEGPYDIGFVVRFKKITELDLFIRKLSSRFNHCISRRVFSVNIHGEYLSRAPLLGKETRRETSLTYYAGNDECTLDAPSVGILRALAMNSRESASAIAQALSRMNLSPLVSPETVVQKIGQLESDRVISGYSIVLNNEMLNSFRFKILLYLNEVAEQTLDSFVRFCRAQGNIVYIVKSLGEWDYELDLEVDELNKCRETLATLVRSFPEVIRDHATLMIRKQHKYLFSP